MKESQRRWNERIRAAGSSGAGRFSQETIQKIAKEGGPIWTYEGPSYNTDAYRKGWDRIFEKKEKE